MLNKRFTKRTVKAKVYKAKVRYHGKLPKIPRAEEFKEELKEIVTDFQSMVEDFGISYRLTFQPKTGGEVFIVEGSPAKEDKKQQTTDDDAYPETDLIVRLEAQKVEPQLAASCPPSKRNGPYVDITKPIIGLPPGPFY
ncbi:uncharacterized protein [Clytia hemisphaerica]|uniref:Uncharacterized protein n=1 Tax=Clytia hemisphaerica TaxID=252671 RepID=A0A7M5WT23_9CNID